MVSYPAYPGVATVPDEFTLDASLPRVRVGPSRSLLRLKVISAFTEGANPHDLGSTGATTTFSPMAATLTKAATAVSCGVPSPHDRRRDVQAARDKFSVRPGSSDGRDAVSGYGGRSRKGLLDFVEKLKNL